MHILGVAVPLGGLVVAASCSVLPRLRAMAFGAVPILFAAAWPGPAQVSAILLSLTLVAILAAGLLDNLLRQSRPAADTVVATITLTIVVTAGAFLLPLAEPSAVPAIPGAAVTNWIETQLASDTALEVDPLARRRIRRPWSRTRQRGRLSVPSWLPIRASPCSAMLQQRSRPATSIPG